MRRFVWPLALTLVAAAGCKAGGGGALEGGVVDGAGVFEVSLNLPDGCPPPTGNEKGVGAPCTMGGKQCQAPLYCACDRTLGVQLIGVPCFCTLFQLAPTGSTDPCGAPLSPTYCGSNAKCCPYGTAAAYCVPGVCIEGNQCPDPFATPP